MAGVDAPEHRYPYVVALARFYPESDDIARFCTGSLIANNWVLIAAHCFAVFDIVPINTCIIMFGNLTITPNKNNSAKILQAISHVRFHKERLKNDVGLLLVEHVELNSYGKLSPIDYVALIGRTLKYVGAGLTSSDYEIEHYPVKTRIKIKKDSVRPLQVGEALAVSCMRWEKRMVGFSTVSIYNNALICLRSRCSNRLGGSQSGDSGGPLLYDDKIVGIAHGSMPSNTYEFFYTAVSPHLDWILRTVATKR
ncbi:serine protease SP24D-like [Pectinophora gossypiella]|uniref:serine protease SP24D-like n=1 Tax=Pectinophora gossypiella TaxID=13191 RepID=UPI00214E8E62|nr:serine protease SP24D-like [Pectinophora gossypiella]